MLSRPCGVQPSGRTHVLVLAWQEHLLQPWRLFANVPRGAELFNSQRSLAVTRGRVVQNKLLLYFSDAVVESKEMKRDALAVAKTFVEGNAPGGSANCFVAVEPPQYKKISNALMGKAKGVLLRHIEEPNLNK